MLHLFFHDVKSYSVKGISVMAIKPDEVVIG